MIIFYHVTDKTKMPGSETVRTIINKKDEILSAVSSHFFSYLLANILASNGLSKIEADTVQDFAEQEREEITNILDQQLNQIIKQMPLGIKNPEDTPPPQIVEQQLIPLLEGLEKIPVVGVMLAQKIRDGLSEMVNQLSTLFEVDITHQDSSEMVDGLFEFFSLLKGENITRRDVAEMAGQLIQFSKTSGLPDSVLQYLPSALKEIDLD